MASTNVAAAGANSRNLSPIDNNGQRNKIIALNLPNGFSTLTRFCVPGAGVPDSARKASCVFQENRRWLQQRQNPR